MAYSYEESIPVRSGDGNALREETPISKLWRTRMKSVRTFLRDESGATAIEYALIASLIAIVIITAVALVGTQVSTVFGKVGNGIQ